MDFFFFLLTAVWSVPAALVGSAVPVKPTLVVQPVLPLSKV